MNNLIIDYTEFETKKHKITISPSDDGYYIETFKKDHIDKDIDNMTLLYNENEETEELEDETLKDILIFVKENTRIVELKKELEQVLI